ncbi:MAG: 6-bladed beta-propeller [Gemmatimonadetes bacterium]|nr:6-bladed beta-propeller [Gemmatimonadota bacterium]
MPESFRPRDVNATQVWGIRHDEMDVQYVAGLRLVPHGGEITMTKQIAAMRALVAWTIPVCALAACSDAPTITLTPAEDWTAEAEYEFGDQLEGDALFGRIVSVRPAADGSRVYVLDAGASEVMIWTPDGTLISRVGRPGEGPGEFSVPRSLAVFEDRFRVGDNRRYTTFALDGEVVETEAFPPPGSGIVSFAGYYGFSMFDDGSIVAVPPSPDWMWDGSEPDQESANLPVLRISQDGGSWGRDTVGVLSFRNVFSSFSVSGTPNTIMQPWVPPDDLAMDPRNGSVVFNRPVPQHPGMLELIEVSTAGDTIWSRRVQLPPIPLTAEDIRSEVYLEATRRFGDSIPSPMDRRSIRSAYIIPEFWPANRRIELMSNGEIWFQPAGQENPGVWYAVLKGEGGPIRRLVLPERFAPMDVNATHVWGIRRDELDVQYVAGLRLVRS